MPIQQTDPIGIRPAQQPPMMQRMGQQTAPMMDAPLSPEEMAPIVNRMPQATGQTGGPRNTEQLLSGLPQLGSPVLDFATRQIIRQNAPAVDQFLSTSRNRSTLQPTTSAGVVDVAGPPTISEPPMAGAARALATRGRGMPGGEKDDMLVHMNRREVQALADASPIGGLPINPDTGMPEAFAFLLPILGGIGGSALGSAGLLGGLGALGGGALGTGLGGFAQGLVQGDSFGDALLRGVVGGVASYGLGSLFQGMSGAADPASQALAGGNAAQQAAVQAADAGVRMTPSMASSPIGTYSGQLAGTNPISGAGPTFMPTTPAITPVNAPPIPFLPAGGTQPAITAPTNIQPAMASVDKVFDPTGMTQAAPSFGSALKDAATDIGSPASLGRIGGNLLAQNVIMPPGTPQIGSDLTPRKKRYNYKQNLPEEGDTQVTAAPEGYVPGRDPQHRYFQNRSFRFQEGGLVDAGIGGLDPKGEQEIVVNAKLAAMGRHPDPETALMAYAERFGIDALRKLIRGVTLQPGEGEALDGPGGGMADLIPAVIDNDQPARLSSGEVVIPADVVSGVGDGDTEAGADRLKDMMAQIRMAKTGSPRQPMPIDEAMAKV